MKIAKNATNSIICSGIQERAKDLVNMHIFENQTMLIEKLLDDGIFDFEDIINHEDDIYEWWLVSDWLAGQLKRAKESMLINAYGTWWGRQATGQAIYMDNVIKKIAKK